MARCLLFSRFNTMRYLLLIQIYLTGFLWFSSSASADDLSGSTRNRLVEVVLAEEGEKADRIAALIDSEDPVLVRKFLTAWQQGELYLEENPPGTKTVLMIEEGKANRVDQGTPYGEFDLSTKTALDTDSALRKVINNTIVLLALADPVPATRRSAALKIGGLQKIENRVFLTRFLEKEKNVEVRRALEEAIATIDLASPETEMKAIAQLAALKSLGNMDRLEKLAQDTTQPLRAKEAARAVRILKSHLQSINFFGTIFRGVSLGSVLLIAALGLAITFGLMGVINMAHGELIAVGAYASFLMEGWFNQWFGPSGVTWYFVAAIPFSFISAAAVGLLLERGIVQFLYRRPLESLLATWGVSLVLQQVFRMIFGAANVQVSSPGWLQGNIAIADVALGYNRIFVICFAAAIVLGTWALISKTSFGLFIRAVMQNMNMASCMGVRTDRVNMMTFAFGSGLAGLAGAFLSQIGNVGPSLGQNYIVDCFMTVVVGGVGKIFGCICSAMGIGMANEMLQQILQNPVLGKITVLVGIILFLQWKPGGIFPSRGRGLED